MDLIYKDEIYKIVGAAMEVYNTLGPGFLEAVYQEALEIELRQRGVPFLPQVALEIHYKDKVLRKTYIADFIAYEKIIVEIKALGEIGQSERAQVINYLKATRLPLGLLVNFGHPKKLEWSRLIMSANLDVT